MRKTKKEIIEIDTEYIKLDSFLKFINVVESGGIAKMVILEGEVAVNGEICTQRGKKLRDGDCVSLGVMEFEVRNVS